jgi:hypothetical protein
MSTTSQLATHSDRLAPVSAQFTVLRPASEHTTAISFFAKMPGLPYDFEGTEEPKPFDGRFEMIEVATVVLENSVVLGLAKSIQENVK